MVVIRGYILRSYCECCGAEENLTRDHIVPRSQGGTKLQTLCFKCNQEKGVLTIDYSTKTFEITPWLMTLNTAGLRRMMDPKTTPSFGSELFSLTKGRMRKYLRNVSKV